jgi:hypothetical protein
VKLCSRGVSLHGMNQASSPSSILRFRGYRVLQSFSPKQLGRLLLTSSPFVLGISRTVGFSLSRCPSIFFKIVGASSHTLRRHLKRLAPMLAAHLLTPLVDPMERSACTSLELTYPSAFAEPEILFFHLLF